MRESDPTARIEELRHLNPRSLSIIMVKKSQAMPVQIWDTRTSPTMIFLYSLANPVKTPQRPMMPRKGTDDGLYQITAKIRGRAH